MTIKQKIRRFKVIELQMRFFRLGMYDEARLVLHLLRNGSIRLGLDDSSARVEIGLEECGLRAYYYRNYKIARYYLAVE